MTVVSAPTAFGVDWPLAVGEADGFPRSAVAPIVVELANVGDAMGEAGVAVGDNLAVLNLVGEADGFPGGTVGEPRVTVGEWSPLLALVGEKDGLPGRTVGLHAVGIPLVGLAMAATGLVA